MKKITFFVIIAFITVKCYSQEKVNKLSVNPIQLFVYNIVNFEYERGFNDGKVGISFFYGATGRSTREIQGYRIYMTEQNASIKRYLKNISTNSFWYGGQLSVVSSSIYGNYGSASNIGTLGITGKLGYQFIIKSFYLDFFGGVGYALTTDLFGTSSFVGGVTEAKISPIIGIKTGIAF